jgi:hypothetical protein
MLTQCGVGPRLYPTGTSARLMCCARALSAKDLLVAGKRSGGNQAEDDPGDGDRKVTIEDVVKGLRAAEARMESIGRRLEQIEATESGSPGDAPRQ